MSAEWYYSSKGEQCGPVSFSKLAKLAKSGRIVPSDYVWTAGMSDWALGATITGLFPTPPPIKSSPGTQALQISVDSMEKIIKGLPIYSNDLNAFVADLPNRFVVQIFPFGQSRIEMQVLRQMLLNTPENGPIFHANRDFVLIRARKKNQWLCLEYQWTFWILIFTRKLAFIEAAGELIQEIEKVVALSLAQFQTGIHLAELREVIVQLRFFRIRLEKRLRNDPATLALLDQPLRLLDQAFDFWRDDSGICHERFIGTMSLGGKPTVFNGLTVAYVLNSFIEQNNRKYRSERHARVLSRMTEAFGQLRALQLAIS